MNRLTCLLGCVVVVLGRNANALKTFGTDDATVRKHRKVQTKSAKATTKAPGHRGSTKNTKAPAKKSSKSSKSGKKGGDVPIVVCEKNEIQNYLTALWEYGYLTNATAPDVLNQGLTSGTAIPDGLGGTPLDFAPSVGCTSFTPFVNSEGQKQRGKFLCLSRGAYGNSRDFSVDYPLHFNNVSISTTFNYGQMASTQPSNYFSPTEILTTVLIMDPNQLIGWENGADVSLAQYTVDKTWNDYSVLRVLVGTDFTPQGMVVLNSTTHAIFADGYSPILVSINPRLHSTVIQPFVRVPDITPTLQLHRRRLAISVQDKVFCNVTSLDQGVCNPTVTPTYPGLNYRLVKAGFGGLARLWDGSVAGFFQQPEDNEPGVRVYGIDPCTADCPPEVTEFLGFYELEPTTDQIADVSTILGSSSRVAVLEIATPLPPDDTVPRIPGTTPVSRLCIANLNLKNANTKVLEKKCLLDFYDIDDKFDVDNNQRYTYGQSRVRAGGILVVDAYCIMAAADANFPFHSVGMHAEVTIVYDHVFMVCFQEPVFSNAHRMFRDYDEEEEASSS